MITFRKQLLGGTVAILLALVLSGVHAVAASPAQGVKRGLPILTFESSAHGSLAGADLFTSVRAANPELYTTDRQYHVFYDSRTGKVVFQNDEGIIEKPDGKARQFVIVWHDGAATDWRYIDSAQAERSPATDKGDQFAHIAWAIKTVTHSPSVVAVGSDQDLEASRLYIAGKAASQFGGALRIYNNDVRGLFATDLHGTADSKISSDVSAKLALINSATDEFASRSSAITSSTVKVVKGINESSVKLAATGSVTFTSKMGPVVWSVMEGPEAATITHAGILTAGVAAGTFHVVAASTLDHAIVAVSPFAVVLSPTVTTKAVSAITSETAAFNSTVNPNGASGVAGFLYALNSAFTGAIGTSTVAVSGSTATNVSITQNRLSPNIQYYVRGFFRDGANNATTLGNVVTFSTVGVFAQTVNASGVTSSDATLNAVINPGGVAGSAYFGYSTNNFVNTLYTAHVPITGDRTNHNFTVNLTALKRSTAFQYRVYFDQAPNSSGVLVGNTISFRTLGIFAENFTVGWATNVTSRSATLWGRYGSGGAAARVWVYISTNPSVTTPSVQGTFIVPAGNYGSPTVGIPVLLARNTTYYFKYAIQNTETGNIVSAPFIRSFTTLP